MKHNEVAFMEKKDNMPSWVYWGLLGIKTRQAALIFVWVCMLIGLICLPLAVIAKDVLLGAIMFPVGLWYWAAIRWVDQNSSWE